MSSEKDFLSGVYCPDEILMESEGNRDVLYIFMCFAYLKAFIKKKLNNLACSGFTVKFQTSA